MKNHGTLIMNQLDRHSLSRHTLFALLFVACGFAAGCSPSAPPEFRLNMVEAVSSEISPEYQQEIANVLGAMFGTPDAPIALAETGLDAQQLALAAGPAWSDQAGVNHGLYRKHCSHCHGVTGDGRGPTAPFLNPYPRDYRQGVYKFKSTYNPARPTDADLTQVLVNGVPGTAMPSFSLLPGSEVESLVEYVKYLSIRGQMETALVQYVYDELDGEEEEAVDDQGQPITDEQGEPVMRRIALDPLHRSEQRDVIYEMLEEIMVDWNEANDQVILPSEEALPPENRTAAEVAASVEKGRVLFYGPLANCVKCHGPTALGDGQTDDYDNWQKVHKGFLDSTAELLKRIESVPQKIEEVRQEQAQGEIDKATAEQRIQGLMSDLEEDRLRYAQRSPVGESLYTVRNAIPRNLRQGIYRGGLRRIDLFHRVYAGIAGTPMPASGPASPGAAGTLTEEQIWNLVDYVQSLPYEPPSRPQRALPANIDFDAH